ncbi:MAG: hypothetical protein JRN26_06340 [Nitrososphaerota archaeon]|jgi:hypothetical protein|nr:hypothetical protein [Nitrososphaerota archaeon]MDG6927151.1 hypothetical protein [Nitrososphaerota archaeon]MDG6931165.1 hypothetical protein [Nitrososphaerota archaeon]MDG6932305.1 hypothetical protein [Nitrososphaerota archaeon]MDG6936481.1 hypothetical protein [Nitrososphaerota archaeon]
MIKYNLKLFVSAFSLRIISFFFQATLPLILIYFDMASARSYWYFILVLWIFGLLGALYSKLLGNRLIVTISFFITIIMAVLLASDIKILLLLSIYIIFMMVSAFSAGSGSSSYVEGSGHRGVSIYSAGLAFGLTVAMLAQLLFFDIKNFIALSLIVLVLILLTAVFYPFKKASSSGEWSISGVKKLLSSKDIMENIINSVSGSMAWPFAVSFLGVYAYKFLNFSLIMVSIAFLISVLTSAIIRMVVYKLHEMPGSRVQKFSVVLYGISIFTGVIFRQPLIFFVSMFILGLAHGIFSPLLLYGFLKNSNDKLMGYLVYNASSGASEILSSVIGGILISQLNYIAGISAFAVFFLSLNLIVFLIEFAKGSVFNVVRK